jgi:hypothetical protein
MRRSAITRVRVFVLFATLVSLVGIVSVSSATAAPPTFTGTVDQFYVVPKPLPPGAPGELIRVQAVSQTATATTVRIMYHSRDGLLRDRAVTGMLTYPKAAPPAGGWPVLSWANGTVGMATQCAPSRAGRTVSMLGIAGVGVQTDYVGLGPVGETHPYLSRPSEGFSVIDAVRAARNLTASGAGPRWMAIGGSQGGHAAISANELGEQYAPELDLLGTVALAPGAMFDRRYGSVDALVARVVSAMALYGGVTEHPEIDPNDYVTPAAAKAASVIQTGCLNEITLAFLAVPFDGFYTHDPLVTEPARTIAIANDVGHFRVDAPLFVVQGTADTTVVPQRTRDLIDRLCNLGQVTNYLEVAGADHGNILTQSLVQVQAWFADRLANRAASTSCAPRPGPPTVVPGVGSVREGNTGTAWLEVPLSLSAATKDVVTVQWRTIAVPGHPLPQAAPGTDYAPGTGTVTFAPGQTRTRVRIAVRGDTQPESDEMLVVSFGSPTHARMGGYWGLGFGSIVDDD